MDVGRVSREQRETQERQELRESDEPQIEHAAGEVIHLPADGDHHHLDRDLREKPCDQVESEIAFWNTANPAVAEGRVKRAEPRADSQPQGTQAKGDRRDGGPTASGTCAQSP